MTVRLHLVRHCAHDELGKVLTGRSAGGSLSPEGRDQAVRLGAVALWREPIEAVQSSPRIRARETAEAIAGPLGLPIEVIDALDEIDFGDWTGQSYDALDTQDAWRAWNAHRAIARPPGGETMVAAVARVVAHLNRLAQTAQGASVVCVSHCDIIRGALAHYLGLGLDHLLRFDIDPGSISTVSVAPWGGRVLSLNGTC